MNQRIERRSQSVHFVDQFSGDGRLDRGIQVLGGHGREQGFQHVHNYERPEVLNYASFCCSYNRGGTKPDQYHNVKLWSLVIHLLRDQDTKQI